MEKACSLHLAGSPRRFELACEAFSDHLDCIIHLMSNHKKGCGKLHERLCSYKSCVLSHIDLLLLSVIIRRHIHPRPDMNHARLRDNM